MRQFLLGLSVSAVFIAGCVAGASNLAVPQARAASAQWSYLCFDATSADDVHAKANAAGAQGWEMVSGAQGESGTVWCFRQAKP
jgi:hypothetical protein